MKQVDELELGRRFRAAVAQAAANGEEIVVMYRARRVARIIPEPIRQTAREAMADLGKTLDAQAAEAWLKKLAQLRRKPRKGRNGTLRELRNPWVT